MRSFPDPEPKQLAYSAAQAHARQLITELRAHLDEHADAIWLYPQNLSYTHIAYIAEISNMLNRIVLHTKGESDES